MRSLIIFKIRHTKKNYINEFNFIEINLTFYTSHGFLQHVLHIFSKLDKSSRGHGNASIPAGPGKPGRPRKPRGPSRPSSP